MNSRSRWWNKLWKFHKPVLIIIVFLALAWYAFLELTIQPAFNANSVLIMVWASVLLLVFAAFPEILKAIKRVKVSDIEIEIQSTVEETSEQSQLARDNLDIPFSKEDKGDIRNLKRIINKSIQQPQKPIVLVVNFSKSIFISYLSLYLFYIELLVRPVTVLFISRLNNGVINCSDIVGVISGKEILREFRLRFPLILQSVEMLTIRNSNLSGENNFVNTLWAVNEFNLTGDLSFEKDEKQLSTNDVHSWFGDRLSKKSISLKFDVNDRKKLLRALQGNEEYLIIENNEILDSVISLNDYSRELTRKFLSKGIE